MSRLLYNYFRSSASYRVRLALEVKGLSYEYRPVHLLNQGGEQHLSEYRKLNPHGQVPCLVEGDKAISQSVAIFEYLEETHPEPPLYPKNPFERAKVREFCETINSGMQPLMNLSTLQHLKNTLGADDETAKAWVVHFISRGFESLEALIQKTAGTYCFGDQVSAADCFLVPQCYAAERYGIEVSHYPTVAKVRAHCEKQEAFKKAHPHRQPDTPDEMRA